LNISIDNLYPILYASSVLNEFKDIEKI